MVDLLVIAAGCDDGVKRFGVSADAPHVDVCGQVRMRVHGQVRSHRHRSGRQTGHGNVSCGLLLGRFCSFRIGVVLGHNLLVDFLNVFLTRHAAVRVGVVSATMLSQIVRPRECLVTQWAYIGAFRGMRADMPGKGLSIRVN